VAHFQKRRADRDRVAALIKIQAEPQEKKPPPP